jgi:hypothetical protein
MSLISAFSKQSPSWGLTKALSSTLNAQKSCFSRFTILLRKSHETRDDLYFVKEMSSSFSHKARRARAFLFGSLALQTRPKQ